MADLQTMVASVDGVSLSLAGLLRALHRGRRLRPLALEALAGQLVLDAAVQAGLSVGDADLQQAADRFRHRHGLTSAEHTRHWLDREGLTVEDFEAGLERELLNARFRQHLTGPRLAGHFAADPARYARVQLRQIVVASEGAARELLAQLVDEGRDFAEVARQHSLHGPSRQAGGSLGVLPRWALPPAVADAVFAAQPGAVVGPFASEQGWHLFRVEALPPPALDDETAAVIRRELFDAWLAEQLHDVRFDFSGLGTS